MRCQLCQKLVCHINPVITYHNKCSPSNEYNKSDRRLVGLFGETFTSMTDSLAAKYSLKTTSMMYANESQMVLCSMNAPRTMAFIRHDCVTSTLPFTQRVLLRNWLNSDLATTDTMYTKQNHFWQHISELSL